MNSIDGSVTAAQFTQTATSAPAIIAKIDQIIAGLLNSALIAIQRGHINSYTLDDKQTVISCNYRNAGEIMKDIQAYRDLRNQYLIDINGRTRTLVNGQAIRRFLQ
jgi:hypothetical protein